MLGGIEARDHGDGRALDVSDVSDVNDISDISGLPPVTRSEGDGPSWPTRALEAGHSGRDGGPPPPAPSS